MFMTDTIIFSHKHLYTGLSSLSSVSLCSYQVVICVQMDFPIQIDTLNMGLSIVFLRGGRLNSINYDIFMSLNVVLILSNTTDPDEMQYQ